MERMGRVEREGVEISDMQEGGRPRDLLLLQVLQGGGATKRVVGPVPNPAAAAADHVLDLELSLGVTTYTGESSKAGSSTSSSSSTSSMMRVLHRSPSNAGEGLAGGAADLPLMGPLVSLERSCSLPHEGEREARKVIWSALAKRRIESTKRFVMQRNAMINGLQAEKRSDRLAVKPMPKLLSSRSEKLPWAAAKCLSISEPLGVQSVLGKRPLVQPVETAKGPELQLPEKKESDSSELLPKLNETISQVISTVQAKGKEVNVAVNNAETSCKKPKVVKNAFEYNGIDVMKLMPSVVTTGDGPNGRTIQGILYKYTAESVRIVCVCHGAFLSPEEFVSHSGRVDKQNPMKHIKVMSG